MAFRGTKGKKGTQRKLTAFSRSVYRHTAHPELDRCHDRRRDSTHR